MKWLVACSLMISATALAQPSEDRYVTREEYERLCEEADRLLAADPTAWDTPPAP